MQLLPAKLHISQFKLTEADANYLSFNRENGVRIMMQVYDSQFQKCGIVKLNSSTTRKSQPLSIWLKSTS